MNTDSAASCPSFSFYLHLNFNISALFRLGTRPRNTNVLVVIIRYERANTQYATQSVILSFYFPLGYPHKMEN